jgi:hypothetical protein
VPWRSVCCTTLPLSASGWPAGQHGHITAYDSRTGARLFAADVDKDAARHDPFLNDVAVTRDAVYVTDSTTGRLFVVPSAGREAAGGRHLRGAAVTGDYQQPDGFGLNGIRVLPGATSSP